MLEGVLKDFVNDFFIPSVLPGDCRRQRGTWPSAIEGGESQRLVLVFQV
jgi:hypothetical protein